MTLSKRWALSPALPLRAFLALIFAGAIATPFVSAGCAGSRACVLWSADKGPCPSRDQAFLMMGGGCGEIESITSDGDFDEDVCCYDVRKNDFGVPCAGEPFPPPGTGPVGVVTVGGPAASCFGVFPMGACDECMQANCCSETIDCVSTPSCLPCLDAQENCPPEDFSAGIVADNLDFCSRSNCAAECFDGMVGPTPDCTAQGGSDTSCGAVDPGQGIECDVFSGQGCSELEVCDVNSSGSVCELRLLWSDACGVCGATGWCGPGLTCVGGFCTPFCCDDSACAAGYCDKSILTGAPGPIGACVLGQGGAGGAGGQGGAGGAGGQGGGAGGQGGAGGAGGQGGGGGI